MKQEMVDVYDLEYDLKRIKWLDKQQPSYIALLAYIKENGTEELEPILIQGNHVVDGVFRCEAVKEAKKLQIPVRRVK